MDRIEQTIRRKDEKQQEKDRAKYRACQIIAVVFLIGAIFFLVTTFQMLTAPDMKLQLLNVLPLLICVIGAIVSFVNKDNMLVEYDYIVEDDTLTVAKIRNLSSRKEIISLPISTLKRIEKYNPQKYGELEGKKLNCSLNGDNEKYVLFYEAGERGVLLFEPNEELLKMLQKELNK